MNKHRNVFTFLLSLLLVVSLFSNSFALTNKNDSANNTIHFLVTSNKNDTSEIEEIETYISEDTNNISISLLKNGDSIVFFTFSTGKYLTELGTDRNYSGIKNYSMSIYLLNESKNEIVDTIIDNQIFEDVSYGSIRIDEKFKKGCYRVIITANSILSSFEASLIDFNDVYNTVYFYFNVE